MNPYVLGTESWKQWRNAGDVTVGAFEVFQVTDSETIGDELVQIGEQPDGKEAVYREKFSFPHMGAIDLHCNAPT